MTEKVEREREKMAKGVLEKVALENGLLGKEVARGFGKWATATMGAEGRRERL